MKKTPLVFVYDYENDVVTDKVKPGSEWVLEGKGVATIKVDGTACLFKEGKLWKRFDRKLKKGVEAKAGDEVSMDSFRDAPEGFVPCEPNPDPVTFHWPGWVPVSADKPEDKYHVEALEGVVLEEGKTYELVGPKFSDNPYNLEKHELWKHGDLVVDLGVPTFDKIKSFLEENYVEGLVFHNKEDGRVAKIRRKDFGLFWIKEDMRKNKSVNNRRKFRL